MCLEKIQKAMKKHKMLMKEMDTMHNSTLQKVLIIIDNAEGVGHEDFFEIAELLLTIDKREEHENRKII